MTNHDAEWWKKRATLRYRQLQEAQATIERVQAALQGHADCSPDDACAELAFDIRAALNPSAALAATKETP